jgi:hypothetical protein
LFSCRGAETFRLEAGQLRLPVAAVIFYLSTAPRITYGYFTVGGLYYLGIRAWSEAAIGYSEGRFAGFCCRRELAQIKALVLYSPVFLVKNDVINRGRHRYFL